MEGFTMGELAKQGKVSTEPIRYLTTSKALPLRKILICGRQ